MKTEDLIDMLSTNVERVKGEQLRNAHIVALVIGGAVAFCLMLGIFGVPADAFHSRSIALKALALAFTLGLVAAGASFLIQSARPGRPRGGPLILIAVLFFVLLAVSCVILALTGPAAWGDIVFGPQWAACLICVPLFAVAPFASLIWALRRGAPTNLLRTGAVAGLVAGALGAAVFAVNQLNGSVPFILIWYGGPIVLCAVVGAILGPRLLRW